MTCLLGQQRCSIDRQMRRKQRMREVALIRVSSVRLFHSAICSWLITIVCCTDTAALFSSLFVCLFLFLSLSIFLRLLLWLLVRGHKCNVCQQCKKLAWKFDTQGHKQWQVVLKDFLSCFFFTTKHNVISNQHQVFNSPCRNM